MVNLKTTEVECHPQIGRLLWFVFSSSRGGLNRIRIVLALKERPHNTNQLANELGLDYKAIQHHLKVLQKNNLIISDGKKYGAAYLFSTYLEANLDVFEKIVAMMQLISQQKSLQIKAERILKS